MKSPHPFGSSCRASPLPSGVEAVCVNPSQNASRHTGLFHYHPRLAGGYHVCGTNTRNLKPATEKAKGQFSLEELDELGGWNSDFPVCEKPSREKRRKALHERFQFSQNGGQIF